MQYKLDEKGLKNITVLQTTKLRSNSMYATFYVFWSKFIFVEVIPYCMIVVLNSLIVIKIWKSIQFRKKLTVRICYTLGKSEFGDDETLLEYKINFDYKIYTNYEEVDCRERY